MMMRVFEVTDEEVEMIIKAREDKVRKEKIAVAMEQFNDALEKLNACGVQMHVKRSDGKTYIPRTGTSLFYEGVSKDGQTLNFKFY